MELSSGIDHSPFSPVDVPRPFTLPRGSGRIIEEASVARPHWEPPPSFWRTSMAPRPVVLLTTMVGASAVGP
jgi:hypothetical protein